MERGEIPLICAGKKRTYELSMPALEDLSTQIFYIGSKHRIASILKLALNINIALITLALAEDLVFARGTGVDPAHLSKFLILRTLGLE